MKAPSFLIIAAVFAAHPFAQAFSGGNGTVADPYLIANKGDLKILSEDTLFWERNFRQTADIAFNAADFDSGGAFFNSGKGFSPIGRLRYRSASWVGYFSGVYDGGGHAVSGVRIMRKDSSNVGFFGTVSSAGIIRNLKLIDIDVTGRQVVGGMVATNTNGTIANSSVTGKVTGVWSVGGLAGRNSGRVSDCQTTVKVTGTEDVGGLVGEDWGKIERSSAAGTVSGTSEVGGLVGTCNCEIASSGASGDVDGQQTLGGLVGRLDSGGYIYTYKKGYVGHSLATGNVSGKRVAGGLVGLNNRGNVDSSYASGNVLADTILGGLVGDNGGSLREDSAFGGAKGRSNVGGLAGRNNDTVFQCFAGGDVQGDDRVGGLIGYTGGINRSSVTPWTTDQSWIRNSAARGNVSGMSKVGGLIGYAYGRSDAIFIDGCYASGKVMGSEQVGGLVGYQEDGKISDSYASGTVLGDRLVGGLIGDFYRGSGPENCYSFGFVAAKENLGGLVGSYWDRTAYAPHSFWDMQTSGLATSRGGVGKTTAELKAKSTFSDSGWDFDSIWTISNSRNSGYPILKWEKQAAKPEVQTIRLSALRNTGLTAWGRINGPGSTPVTAFGFVWNTTGNPGRGKDTEKNLGGSNDAITFPFDITNLNPNTRYFVRAFAVNGSGLSYGAEFSALTVPYGGSGSEQDPYRIAGLPDLKYLSEVDSGVAWPNTHYALSQDIAFSEADFAKGGAFYNNGEGFVPLGRNWGLAFRAFFNGGGHSISGIRINRPDSSQQGFIGTGAMVGIQDLRLIDIHVTGKSYVGGLVGSLGSGALTHCSVTGAILGKSGVGGLIGSQSGGRISFCFSNAKVTGSRDVGGFNGSSSGDTVENSYATGNVEGDTGVGGFAGSIGRWKSRVASCFAAGNVSGKVNVGGFAGNNDADTTLNAYARGAVSGRTNVGGFAGLNSGTIINAYATGRLIGDAGFGGFVGSSSSPVINSFWDLQSSSEDLSAEGAGKTTAQMKSIATYTRKNPKDLTEAWDFVNNPNDDASNGNYWALSDSINGGYPYLNAIGNAPVSLFRPQPLSNSGRIALRISREGRGLVLETEFESRVRLTLLDPLGRNAMTGESPDGKVHAFSWNVGRSAPALAAGRYIAVLQVMEGAAGPMRRITAPFVLR
jgi:hypothetical protein